MKLYESQDDAVLGILNGGVVAGDVVVIEDEGPRGARGMQEMLYPTEADPESRGPGKACARSSPTAASRRHLGPLDRPRSRPRPRRAGSSALSKLGRPGPPSTSRRERSSCPASDETLAERRAAMAAKGKDAWKPAAWRKRNVTTTPADVVFATSAARGR